ncbi:MAG: thioredoxin family protein [Anaerolineales bacterium]|jgi:thiol:disulfide interchange protein|nr:thioredoxin family protein [Anaerolineales bacterium]
MLRLGYFLSLLLVLTLACSALSAPVANPVEPVQEIPTALPQNIESPTQDVAQTSELQNSALVDFYDPARNPADDLTQAIVVAQKENKRIMLELGGDWCIWCKYMDDFYKSHPDILQVRVENYVLVKVNVSEENENLEFLSQFPEAAGYPHIYILESDGTLLHSQNTADLEDGADSYVPEVFVAFLQEWAPAK